MKKLTTTMASALAVLLLASGAWAGDFEAQEVTENVDWEEAIEWAELVETYERDGRTWEVYLDEEQALMWEQPTPSDLGPGETMEDSRTVYVNPFSLKFCHNANCSSSTGFTSFTYCSACSTRTTRVWYALGGGSISNVDRIIAYGNSSTTDYCDNDYYGYYNDLEETSQPYWRLADNRDCGYGLLGYWYEIDESGDLSNWTYGFNDYVVRWRYEIGSSTRYTVLKYQWIE